VRYFTFIFQTGSGLAIIISTAKLELMKTQLPLFILALLLPFSGFAGFADDLVNAIKTGNLPQAEALIKSVKTLMNSTRLIKEGGLL